MLKFLVVLSNDVAVRARQIEHAYCINYALSNLGYHNINTNPLGSGQNCLVFVYRYNTQQGHGKIRDVIAGMAQNVGFFRANQHITAIEEDDTFLDCL